MAEPFKLGEIRGEVKALSCFKSFNPDTKYATNSLPAKSDMGYFGVSVKKEDEHATKGRQHVFKKVWERNIDPNPRLVGKPTGKDSYAINWKHWPPPIPEIVPGLKIPVEIVPQVDYRLSQTGLWREVNSGTEAKPVDPKNWDFFDNISGSLNTALAQWFSISPPSLLFLNSKMGEFYQVTLKLRNIGHIPRRIRVIPPYSKSFQILWGSDLHEKTLISPGLTTRVVVQFKPANNNAINDILMVVIDGDGALVVPMMSASATPPILETIEWDCGCSAVGNERSKCFDLKNVGGDARFWILSEDEFKREYLAVFRDYEKRRNRKMSESGRPSCNVKTKFKLDQVYTRCFRLYPSCFRLQRNQKIEIKIRYQPKEAKFHYEKLALLCDNGEIRWIAMRGMGLDTKSPGLLELKGDWSAPPCDLPSDLNCNYIIDCGDLVPGELSSQKFTITNKSCLPMYFFWCLRPIQNADGALPNPMSKSMLQRQIEGTLQVDWEDYDMKMNNSRPVTPVTQISIFPAQGIIEGKQEIVCTATVSCPKGTGYHSGVLSIFVEQVNDAAKAVIRSMIKELEDNNQNDVPMHYQDLIQTMPEIPSWKKHKADLYRHFHSRSIKFAPGTMPYNEEAMKNIMSHNHPHHQHEHGNKQKRRSSGFGRFEDETSSTPIFLMKRTTDNEATFELTELQLQGEKVVVESNDKTEGDVSEEQDEQHKECEEPAEEAKSTNAPLNMYQKLMELQQKLEEVKITGNYELIGDLMKRDTHEPAKTESKIVKTEEKSARTENDNGEETLTAPETANEGKEDEGEDEEVKAVTPEPLTGDHDGSPGLISEKMSEYIRNSIVSGPKMWLKDTSALMPVKEVEIWMRSIPLQCWFYPPFIIAFGTSGWIIERTIQFHNQSKHSVEVEWEKIIDDVCCISCDPQAISVKSLERTAFRVKIQFQNFGKMHSKLNGTMKLPFSVIPCNIGLEITTTSPSVEILTPLLSFGLLTYGTEKVKSLAIKNTGIKKVKWRAKLADDALENEENEIIAKHQTKIISGQLLRVWPQWGILDPGEVAGAQVYLSAEVYGRVATSIEIIIDENPTLTTFVSVCAEVQTPVLYFESGFYAIPLDFFLTEDSYKSTIKINNPTGFYLAFSWQCPIGRQSESCTVEIEPKISFVAPKASTECRVVVTNPENLRLCNLFVPCCVEGMNEPLILKIFTTNP